jgi:DNA polymerase-1
MLRSFDPAIYKIGCMILDARRAGKLASTYFSLTLDEVDRYHPEWKMHGTETGRYSCHVHTYPPGKARSIFVAPSGMRLVVADLSQIELRIMWHQSQDPVGLAIMEKGGDSHRETAAEIFRKSPEEISGEERFQAKFINFGLPYGRGPESMAEQHTSITLRDAQDIFDRHHHRFSRLWEWMAINNIFSAKNKYIANPFGRRRYFIEQSDSERERQTQNMIPQSTAHDLLMQIHVDIHDDPRLRGKVFPVFDHHDAMGMEVPEEGLEEHVAIIRQHFEKERLPGLRTPTDVKVLQNWGEAKR